MRTFEVYVPAGWVKLDLAGDPGRSIARAVDRVTSSVPPELRARVRILLRQQLLTTAGGLADGGAVCLIMPLVPLDEMPLRPVIVAVPITVPDDAEPMDLLLAVASADSSSEIVEVDGLVALRTISTADLTGAYTTALNGAADVLGIDHPAPSGELPQTGATATRVRYMIGDPADRERWVDFYFSVDHQDVPAFRELAAAAVELFDAQMQTFRWTA